MDRVVPEDTQPGVTGDQEPLFRLLVESVQDYAIFLLDTNGYVRSWNEGAQRIKGYTPDEIIGKHFSIFYPAREAQRGKPDYGLRVAADEGRWQEEGWRIRKDGSRFWASVVLTALFDANHELVGFAKVTRDLTDRKRAEEERAQLLELEHAARTESEMLVERLRAIQSVTEAALSDLNLDDLLVRLLDRVAEILAVDTVTVLLLDEDTNMLVARAAKGIEDEVEQGVRVPVGSGFAGRIAADRQAVVLDDVERDDVWNSILVNKGIRSLLGVPLVTEKRVLGVLHVGSRHRRQFNAQDVELLQIVADRVALAIDHANLVRAAHTARQEAELAEATVKARDEFISIAAHELKTPLTSLQIASQSLLRRLEKGTPPDERSLERSLRTVERQVGRLSRLVTQLLETVRVQAGRLEVHPTPTDLKELIDGVVEQMQLRAGAGEIIVDVPTPVTLSVDPLRFEQVLTNLLDNAVKFSPEAGRVEVTGEKTPDDTVRMTVRDHGIGVPPGHRAHLFERFYQAHGSDHRSGMGLGLYITRQIVEMHAGRIDVEFPEEGGTRFIVEIPAALAEAQPQESA
ncbi:MAG TPA: PAS domain-containing sensor histidine kinase [Chloroflexota bacterium]|nr:PAS domain-containing sensor histidine kinase [Chloroflexota bacterium]